MIDFFGASVRSVAVAVLYFYSALCFLVALYGAFGAFSWLGSFAAACLSLAFVLLASLWRPVSDESVDLPDSAVSARCCRVREDLPFPVWSVRESRVLNDPSGVESDIR